MNIKEMYDRFERIGSFTFATINGDYPETRIAHFVTYDDEGLYFMTMDTKPFYTQLIDTLKVSACGLSAPSVTHDEDGMSLFEPGYSIRVTGDIREISFEELQQKAQKNDLFNPCIKDIEKYPAMVTFVLYRGTCEVFDYDFEKAHRDHKIERTRYNFGGFSHPFKGMLINDDCIRCNKCFKTCSFDAIIKTESGKYEINQTRCDVCGSCALVCPKQAIDNYR